MFQDNEAFGDHNTARHRKKRQQRRMLNSLLEIFRADDRVTTIGRDPLFRALIDERFDVHPAIAKCQVLIQDQPVTVVVVPDRLWHRPGAMDRLVDARRAMAELNRVCLLLPQSMLDLGSELVGAVMQATLVTHITALDPDRPTCMPVGVANQANLASLVEHLTRRQQ